MNKTTGKEKSVIDNFTHFMAYTGYHAESQEIQEKLKQAYFDGSEKTLLQTLAVGDITISHSENGAVWMTDETRKDGATFRAEELNAVLKHFYADNF